MQLILPRNLPGAGSALSIMAEQVVQALAQAVSSTGLACLSSSLARREAPSDVQGLAVLLISSDVHS